MGTTPCPGCGVAVTVGYARCPRCHAPMPGASRTKRPSVAGGTSVDALDDLRPDDPRGSSRLLLAVVLGLAMVVAAILVARALGDDDRGAAAEPVTTPIDEPVMTAPAPSRADEPVLPPSTLSVPDPAVTAAALERALAGARLFGTVRVLGDTVEIRSAACAEPAMGAELGRYAADLRAGGVASARCLELHGAEVFARPL